MKHEYVLNNQLQHIGHEIDDGGEYFTFKKYGMAPPRESFSKFRKVVQPESRPALPALLGCLFVPWLIFTVTFWLRSFEVHRDSEMFSTFLCGCLALPVAAFAYMAYGLAMAGGDAKPMMFLFVTGLISWFLAFTLGGANYTHFMKPFYDFGQLNVYPNVDPSLFVGNSMMDAGMVQFSEGSRIDLSRSMGFKNEDIYCVAPIVSGSNQSQSTFDFWAIGLNCCSPHRPDFKCGEYTNPRASWGLRLMDDSKRDMFRMAVLQASAAFSLKADHPLLVYWLSEPQLEVNAYQDDGFKAFLLAVFACFATQLFLVVSVLCMLVKM